MPELLVPSVTLAERRDGAVVVAGRLRDLPTAWDVLFAADSDEALFTATAELLRTGAADPPDVLVTAVRDVLARRGEAALLAILRAGVLLRIVGATDMPFL